MSTSPIVTFDAARLAFGSRVLWEGLDLQVQPGEFLAVLGPNGSGKTSFINTMLGTTALNAGTVSIAGDPVRRGSELVGLIPQQRPFGDNVPLRARDLVALGVDGNRPGIRLARRKVHAKVDELLELVGAQDYAHRPVSDLSGGEQQRLRAAQALAGDPRVLLCDEPLLSLDLHHQQAISEVIHRQAVQHGAAVIFVTHEINPILPYVDRVLYLAEGKFHLGSVDEVMRSEVLSALYGAPVQVLRVNGRIVVLSGDGNRQLPPDGHEHPEDHALETGR
ncbi:ABC transporter ATP-binding protein [Arthrobacter sp. MYb211]|uniref:metal ABC transporter ATP-binding protein n=1 Tax=Micrococcaceae TaxID=1268 RepID=UPI000CFE13DD|nr:MULTISPECIES: metal ABC transporter ATP-binding protein [unclassified Arthrobacter]PQZ97140.1 ABC transporter ATP-binding protein [Arthrobacter sp. MYb224]PQZ99998.1 ABC transporter ATP-binding protein [Arthrobacter sp. MYb229]PRA08382.1 ABC transporter ATP-binding protein [Arthrobacter sp. MYb221]PRB48327.1 ABC transporter ATP-binding protein [Arthrobacter sp. MYb216]PRC03865.1 ABC transporter ATP-binding protein [Arthrobacter sp. MYb211]